MENIVEKGEIAYFEQFHLFLQCFPKAFVIKVLNEYIYMEERVKSYRAIKWKKTFSSRNGCQNIAFLLSFSQHTYLTK